LVNGETKAVLGGALAYGGTAQNAINAGSYLITASGLTSGNYTLSYVNGVLTVNPAAPVTPAKTKSTDSARPPEPVRNVTSLLTANLTSPSGSNQPSPFAPPKVKQEPGSGQPSANKDAQGSGSGQGASGKQRSSDKSGQKAVAETTMEIGENGPTVKVVDGGLKLPGNNQSKNKKNAS
jgi:hypothetical protein